MAKTKALISFAVTVKLICVFDFAHADCWVSHAAAQLYNFCKFTDLNLDCTYVGQCVQ